MYKRLILLLFLFLPGVIWSQKTKTQTNYYIHELKESEGKVDKNGWKQGEWKFWDAEGNLVITAEYKNDSLDGKQTTEKLIFKTGLTSVYNEKSYQRALARQKVSKLDTILEITNYKKGKQHGLRKIYDPNGTVVSEMEYVNGLKQGEVRMYHYLNGKLTEKHFYQAGKTDSAWFYDENEKINQKSFLIAHGKKSEYFKDGKLYLQIFELIEENIHQKITCAWVNQERVKCDTVKTDYSKEKLNAEEIFVVVEVQPEFPGGLVDLFQFVITNLSIDTSKVTKPIKGKVYVQFVVRNTGQVTEPMIMRGLNPEIDRAVLEMIGKMPLWNPARQRGNPVHCRFIIPVFVEIKE